jgi:hypothetical protein
MAWLIGTITGRIRHPKNKADVGSAFALQAPQQRKTIEIVLIRSAFIAYLLPGALPASQRIKQYTTDSQNSLEFRRIVAHISPAIVVPERIVGSMIRIHMHNSGRHTHTIHLQLDETQMAR